MIHLEPTHILTLCIKVKIKLNIVCFDIFRDSAAERNNKNSATLKEKINIIYLWILYPFIGKRLRRNCILFSKQACFGYKLQDNRIICILRDTKNGHPRAKTSIIPQYYQKILPSVRGTRGWQALKDVKANLTLNLLHIY